MVTKAVVYHLITTRRRYSSSYYYLQPYRHVAKIVNLGKAADILGGLCVLFTLLDEARVNNHLQSSHELGLQTAVDLLHSTSHLCYS